MIEVFRKGFRLDIPPDTLVTFKKAQNLNGVQSRYAYSNTISIDKTGNNLKLLELLKLPSSKAATLMNGYEVDIVLNGSIQLRNQIAKITKETLTKVDLYFLYSENTLVGALKNTFLNALTSSFKYKKTMADFNALKNGTVYRTGFVETQPKSGFFVLEEMPVLINLQGLVKSAFVTNNYTVYGDFFEATSLVKDYWVAPNKGVYQIYSGSGDGFAPTFDPVLDAYTFLNQVLQYFNCYASVDDTNRTVVMNSWKNLGNYKTNYADYSKYFENYQDYIFQSKLAKRNDMTYADSGSTFNSFFPNNLSSEIKATYMASTFGAGSLNTFDDSTREDSGFIGVRPNGFTGEISSVRIFKMSSATITKRIFREGSDGILPLGVALPGYSATAKQAQPVSMGDVYTEFHKDYVEFILTPLISNIHFRYGDIMAADFSMTRVFFVEQLASYWIPLELNYTTAKDKVVVKAMLVKKRKVPAPLLNNFNSVFLDFKEKALFPLEYLNGMYPIPPNEYPWDVVVFKSYNQNENRLYINDLLVPAASLPQSFNLADIATMKLEANKDSDTVLDKNTDSLYLQAIDTNGGVSNPAYINIKHTGVASLESNFRQEAVFEYSRAGFDDGNVYVSLGDYYQGPKPNLNLTNSSAVLISNESGADDTFNLISSADNYGKVTIEVQPFTVFMQTDNNGVGKARAVCRLYTTGDGLPARVMQEASVNGNQSGTFTFGGTYTFTPFTPGNKIRIYLDFHFDNRQTASSGSMDVTLQVSGFEASVSTIKTV